MSKKILEIKELKREFTMGVETVRALKGINFAVEAGEFVTIMGSSGSGKTTLLNILGCLDKPTIGDYFLDGVDVKKLSRDELAQLRNHKIGFVFQAYNLLPRTTALENVELPLLYNKEISSEERRKRAIHALEAVKLADRHDHTPSQLSGGQQQLVGIARAVIHKPSLLLADEPTGNLHSAQAKEIMEMFKQLNDEGTTIVQVTHSEVNANYGSRTIELRDGWLYSDTANPQAKETV